MTKKEKKDNKITKDGLTFEPLSIEILRFDNKGITKNPENSRFELLPPVNDRGQYIISCGVLHRINFKPISIDKNILLKTNEKLESKGITGLNFFKDEIKSFTFKNENIRSLFYTTLNELSNDIDVIKF